jgi:hypothetical protein
MVLVGGQDKRERLVGKKDLAVEFHLVLVVAEKAVHMIRVREAAFQWEVSRQQEHYPPQRGATARLVRYVHPAHQRSSFAAVSISA